LIVIDTSVWLPLLGGRKGPVVDLAREAIEGPEDIGLPGVVLEEILRGVRSDDARHRQLRDLLLADFTYLDVERSTFLLSADIYRALRKRGRTIRSPVDCLIAACCIEADARLVHDDADFRAIAAVSDLRLFQP
jgi:predicted nucleic acid-binding protein